MARALKFFFLGLGLLAVCMPPAFILTFLLAPLWSWIEARYGIESIGHSGPADWCFYAVYALVSAIAFAIAGIYLRLGKAKAI